MQPDRRYPMRFLVLFASSAVPEKLTIFDLTISAEHGSGLCRLLEALDLHPHTKDLYTAISIPHHVEDLSSGANISGSEFMEAPCSNFATSN
ncbi:hypothetical protein WN943_006300 [Citrus x changshan-huyou]